MEDLFSNTGLVRMAHDCVEMMKKRTGEKLVGIIDMGIPFNIEFFRECGLDDGVKHFDISYLIRTKEKNMDYDTFHDSMLVPAISMLAEKVNDLGGTYNCFPLDIPETSRCSVVVDDKISIRVGYGYNYKSQCEMFSIDIALIQKSVPKVFLGGTCNESLWREALIKDLKIGYFNPVVKDWTPECMDEEIKQRKECDICLYVITPRMTGVYSIAEVVDDSNKRPEKTVLCVAEYDSDPESPEDTITYERHVKKSLIQSAKMVEANGGKVFQTLEDTLKYLNSI